MIINSILSLAFIWSCRKCLIRLKEIAILRHKITKTEVLPVAQAIHKVANELPAGRKVFMIVRGLIRMKNKIKGENSIYSLIQESSIKLTKLSEYLRRGSWNDLPSKSFYHQPYSLKQLVFELQDMNPGNTINQAAMTGVNQGTTMNQIAPISSTLQIRGIKKSALSGILAETFKSTDKDPTSSSFVVRVILSIYNFVASRMPFGLILSPTTLARETTLYSVQDGQYALAIGQFEKAADGRVVCCFPNHITKQASFTLSKLRKKYNRLCLITFLLITLLSITGVKVVRKLVAAIRQWQLRRQADAYDHEEERSENEGENCNCALCYVNIRTIIFKPCRHYAICRYCYQQLPANPNCPFCKRPIEDIIEVIKVK